MHQLHPSVEVVEQLLAEGSNASLTYAALECRLAIEFICYEHLRNAHDYISHSDLRKWQPRDVVTQLMEEVDESTTKTFTLSVARGQPKSLDVEGYGNLNWKPVGTQVGFEPKKLGELWNALSNVALHLRLPKSKDDHVTIYGDGQKIREKVIEALEEIKRISQGGLISSGLGEVVSFTCECGTKNTRRAGLLTQGKVVSCIKPACDESYECEIHDNGEIDFWRRTLTVNCRCEGGMTIPQKSAEKLKTIEQMRAVCEKCGEEVLIQWRLMQARRSSNL